MKFRKLTAAALAAAMLLSVPATGQAGYYCAPKVVSSGGGSSAAPWLIIGCAGGVVLAALAANYRDGRELTAREAWSCGTLFLFSRPRNRP
jgi:hypothetical protein